MNFTRWGRQTYAEWGVMKCAEGTYRGNKDERHAAGGVRLTLSQGYDPRERCRLTINIIYKFQRLTFLKLSLLFIHFHHAFKRMNQKLKDNRFEASSIGCRINNGVLNVSVPQIILNEPGVASFIRKRIATGMPEHMWMYVDVNVSGLASLLENTV